MHISIYSRKQLYALAAANYTSLRRTALIVCTSYTINPSRLPETESCLIQSFEDRAAPGPASFSSRLARQAAQFIQTRDTSEFAVCCDSAMSRSPAMAAAILRYNGQSDRVIWQNPHYQPNPLVYRLMCDALGCSISPWKLRWMIRSNQAALKKAIRRAGMD